MLAEKIQIATNTRADRYPLIFSTIATWARKKQSQGTLQGPLKALSFGCSTGEEMLTIRKYLPHVDVYGCDVDDAALTAAVTIPGTTVFRSSAEALAEHGPFTFIFCMSVLCLYGRAADDIKNHFPFWRFEQAVADIGAALRPGGLLVLFNTSYFFQETSTYERYTPIPMPDEALGSFVNRYDPEGVIVARRTQMARDNPAYEYLVPESDLPTGGMRDAIFQKCC